MLLPIHDAELVEKEAFYRLLQADKKRVLATEALIIMCDLNAKVGSDNFGREITMGSQVGGNMNENEEMLCDFCGFNNMII